MKRLRKKISPKKIRYYVAGEYGKEQKDEETGEVIDKLGRPHYHAIIFGHDFPDKKLHRIQRENKIYRSPTLEKLWPFGFSEIGNVTFASAGYVARYCMKKINGDQSQSHYEKIDKETGEVIDRQPEYNDMSRRPGIGKEWYDKYGKTDVHQNDEIITRDGKRIKTPKYYDKLLAKVDPETLKNIKECREQTGKAYYNETHPKRLEAREKNARARLQRLRRELQ